MKRLLNYLQPSRRVASASLAKERLQIIISHERVKNRRTRLLEDMQEELVAVIAKHLHIEPSLVKNQVKLDFAQNKGHSVLELNITLPEEELALAD